jgi:UDP-2,3-diacylglucosamine pyrophosphatase LpxH
VKVFDFKKHKDIEYCSWGDLHIGNAAVCTDAIKKFIQHIQKKDNRYFSLVGDLIEGKTVDNPHFDIDIHVGKNEYTSTLIHKQCDNVIELFEPIADRCLFVSPGNHERNRSVKNVFKPEAYIAKGLGCECGTYANIAQFENLNIYEWHGGGFSNPMAGDYKQIETNRQIFPKRKMRFLAGDCEVMIMHHIHRVVLHEPAVYPIIIFKDGERKMVYRRGGRVQHKDGSYEIEENDRWYCVSGSALRAYVEGVSTYAEEKGYPPTELGYIKVIIKDGSVEDVEKVRL